MKGDTCARWMVSDSVFGAKAQRVEDEAQRR